ncbi:transcriptional regulator, LysR family [Myxococcus fulvus]|uniref:LysR family transcriptional regulator n=1 Tax=Myxococcus fulvus TaxID=33 RepID=A0A511SZK8_MYXFU|nr:LysR substrate-binding domain-containing protein [Myxococcus fulvus]GEN07341.1 LysR family transcriptional regulator [Myxococcus fulvus]SET95316.1 transcriptional regulator, LysR family [Myxococcus fulvus]
MFNVVDLRQVDLNLLVVFATVFRERSVKRAAERLFVGQSAVSMALGRLRELLQDDLFVKVASGVEPTSKAVTLEPLVLQALELVHGAVYAVRPFDPASASRIIRVGLSDDLELWLLPVLLDVLRSAAPGVTLVVRGSHWYTGLGLVERGEVDLALGVLPKPGAALAAETLFHERFTSIFDPALVEGPLTLKRFLGVAHVMANVSGDLVGLVDEALQAEGRRRYVAATVPGFATLGSLVRGRPLIATLPGMAAAQLARAHGLAMSEPPVAMSRYPLSMVWHTKTENDAALQWFRQQVREQVPRLVPPESPVQASRRRPPRRRR